MWGYVGDTAEEDFIVNEVEGTGRAYLFPHLHFYLGFNKNRIVSAKVTTDVSTCLCEVLVSGPVFVLQQALWDTRLASI